MKKHIIFASMLVGITASAQDYNQRVGINTETPRASLEVKAVNFDGRTQGILFPHISEAEKAKWDIYNAKTNKTGLVAGTMVWNTDKKCLDFFDGEKWQCSDATNITYIKKSAKADVWDRTHYIASFRHNGANIDGVINNTTNKLTLQIPYNQATVGGDYNEINVNRTIKDRSGKDVLLTLHIPEGSINTTKGFLTATIKVGNGTTDTFSVKQLAANTEEVLTTFTFSINGNVSNVKLIASGGVLDKNFTKANYKFIYVPVSAYVDQVSDLPDSGQPYEKKWLNNNLGANYAKVGANKHTQQATSADDHNAYGSLFQWQRPADGHELITWSNATTASNYATAVASPQGGSAWTATHSNFISNDKAPYSWVDNTTNAATSNKDLWLSGKPNNPCPQGYHPPTNDEWTLFHTSMGGSKSSTYWAVDNALHLSATGFRNHKGELLYQGTNGYYWGNSTTNNTDSVYFRYNPSSSMVSGYYRVYAFGVRCIAD